MTLNTMVNNGWMLLKYWFLREIMGKDGVLLTNPGGRLVDIDDWYGYQDCERLGCDHYLCEHAGYGECGNAGCDCKSFLHPQSAAVLKNEITRAARGAYWNMKEVPGVEDVKVRIETVIYVDVTLDAEHDAQEHRYRVYDMERTLYSMYPQAGFDFNLTFGEDKTQLEVQEDPNE